MKKICCILALLVSLPSLMHARIKLVALPERARVVVALDRPDATLLEEERELPLQEGMNHVDFAWRGVNIDASTIQLRFLNPSTPIDFKSITTSYPPNENALVWEFASPKAFQARVRISYILSGLTRDIVYKATVEPDETAMLLKDYVRLRNGSGEDLMDAEFNIGYGDPLKRNLAFEEVLELLTGSAPKLPIQKTLNWDAAKQPWKPEYEKNTVGLPLFYVFTNNEAAKLGKHTLLPGKARIFIKTKEASQTSGETAGEGLTFIGEDWATLTPVDREMKLNIGQSRDVRVTQLKTKDERVNMRRNTGNTVVMWDTDEIYKVEVENFKKQPVALTLVEHVPGTWKMVESGVAYHRSGYKPDNASKEYTRKDAFTFEYNLQLPPDSNGTNNTVVTFNLTRLNVQDSDPSSF